MSINVTLSPSLEAFARERVESGEYASIDDVVRDALLLLQAGGDARAAFVASLVEATEEADRDGWVPLEDVLAELDVIIETADRAARER